MLPQTDSLSLTLDEFYTTTTVNFNQALNEDQFYLDGELVSANKAQKVVKFMDLVRQLSGRTEYAQIASVNNVPMAAGLASSASAFAALAGAAAKGCRPGPLLKRPKPLSPARVRLGHPFRLRGPGRMAPRGR
jgi:diphosphomevalonate decarboxylase